MTLTIVPEILIPQLYSGKMDRTGLKILENNKNIQLIIR
jgi:hypothetical protein